VIITPPNQFTAGRLLGLPQDADIEAKEQHGLSVHLGRIAVKFGVRSTPLVKFFHETTGVPE
jgi:hypothetical protein